MSDTAQTPDALGIAELVVAEKHLAASLALQDKDEFPAVMATVAMIGLMEIAGARAMHKLLQPGELSVGVTVDVNHVAPTSLGDTARAEARFKEMDGKLYVFEVVAKDSGGIIGQGIHKRAIVNQARLLAKAKDRLAKS